MIGKTMGLYFARRFFKNTVLIFALIFFLIYAIDLIELLRRAANRPDQTLWDTMTLGLTRAPKFAEQVFPFAVLFGAMATLFMLNRRMELVVARSAGVSAWQFLFPAGIVAVLLGLFSSMVFNPLAVTLEKVGRDVEARILAADGNNLGQEENFWFRENSADGAAIIGAKISRDGGKSLTRVAVITFNLDGTVANRIDARSGRFVTVSGGPNFWEFDSAVVTRAGEGPISRPKYTLSTNLTEEQLRKNVTEPQDLSFWELPQFISEARDARVNSAPYQVYWQTLLARPLLFLAMVIIAGTVSLQFARFGQAGRLILVGIGAGFMLYIVTELVKAFGSNGIVPASFAVWAPVLVATLLSTTLLLYREDG